MSSPDERQHWLGSLERESWQLELLITGFAIFLLTGAYAYWTALERDLVLLYMSSRGFGSIEGLYHILRIGILALTGCLLVHVVLRGMWIAAIGLRSVSGEIDYGRLGYRPVFDRRLRRSIGRFDDYLTRLDRYCSVLFSFAFLLLFSIVGIGIYLTFTTLIGQLVNYLVYGEIFGPQSSAGNWTIWTLVGLGLVYAFDFTTMGLLKRSRWLARPYYWLYVPLGYLTLARFYRPLYYNLIDNRFGRRFAVAVPLIILVLVLFFSLHYSQYTYLPGQFQGGTTLISDDFYEDERTESSSRWRMTLDSRFVRNDYVQLFVPYIPIYDDELIELASPGLVPGRNPGVYLRGGFSLGGRNNAEADNRALLDAFAALYRLFVNDSLRAVAPRFHTRADREQAGLLYVIPVHDLPVGEHRLRLDKRELRQDSVLYQPGLSLYFYK